MLRWRVVVETSVPVHVKGRGDGRWTWERCWSYAVPGMTRGWWLRLPPSARGWVQRVCWSVRAAVTLWEGHLVGVHLDEMIMIKVSEEKHKYTGTLLLWIAIKNQAPTTVACVATVIVAPSRAMYEYSSDDAYCILTNTPTRCLWNEVVDTLRSFNFDEGEQKESCVRNPMVWGR
jgi:hypothetical protein